ncbi:pyridoxamine 5'-phosphate oxidase [Actinoplanes sp. SE50]|uniref:pyridoxine/pyridoxamine 5'-phosphate oxidase n=1 Tax=unclassified Actinoplanes TaxID=2626549 RepID=UPI00023ECE2D|nr:MULTISPECIES: pyridoxal 5'-phosphate synthase [unclassified Actinoplanes]AEV82706.1 pyridoxamine 5'-phosphate oxidase [Actinoplanes sp. SE50/110]ATO81102.1 pyridoxamine 5'-phosphate oxidase [Actinoplanes sp. SE50]SLL98509.1 pyridoxamine 5'-phosphate oxidase [Actinoplanes sp. SE50/110]
MGDIGWLLRSLPVMAGDLPRFDPGDTPDDPFQLFRCWLGAAVVAGVREPHTMFLSTVDEQARPDTRVVMLRDLDARGWQFVANRTSAKGRQLTANPAAALGLHWHEQGRQIRVRGTVVDLGPEAAAADFLGRPQGSRLATLNSAQSDVIADPADVGLAAAEAERLLAEHPDFVPASHVLYAVAPDSVEFWQGDASRRHVRLRYRRTSDGWHREQLWP